MKKYQCTICGYVHEGDAPLETRIPGGGPHLLQDPLGLVVRRVRLPGEHDLDGAPRIGEDFADEIVNARQRVGSELRAQRARVADLKSRLIRKVGEDGDEDALLIASGPADDLETCGLMFTQAINSARERIWIASPYFVPDRAIVAAVVAMTSSLGMGVVAEGIETEEQAIRLRQMECPLGQGFWFARPLNHLAASQLDPFSSRMCPV